MTPLARMLDPKIFKRVVWIANCSDVGGFSVITFDDWRTNTFKVFLEIDTVRIWYEKYGARYWRTIDLVPKACYYLGQFGWYWDYSVGEGLPPTSPRIGNILPWPYREAVTTGEYLPMNIYTDQDIILFHGQAALDNIKKQQAFIARRKRQRESCLAANFPYTPKTEKRTVINEDTPMDWPGTPTGEMTPPTPDAPPTPPEQAGPGVTIVKLTALYGETPPTRPDGLTLTVTL